MTQEDKDKIEQILKNLWKSADGKNLPEYDREVIALTQPYPLKDSEFAVSFAHRPNPKGYDAKNIVTGKIEHYTPRTYDKGGWNIPDIKYWLDTELPKETKLEQKVDPTLIQFTLTVAALVQTILQ